MKKLMICLVVLNCGLSGSIHPGELALFAFHYYVVHDNKTIETLVNRPAMNRKGVEKIILDNTKTFEEKVEAINKCVSFSTPVYSLKHEQLLSYLSGSLEILQKKIYNLAVQTSAGNYYKDFVDEPYIITIGQYVINPKAYECDFLTNKYWFEYKTFVRTLMPIYDIYIPWNQKISLDDLFDKWKVLHFNIIFLNSSLRSLVNKKIQDDIQLSVKNSLCANTKPNNTKKNIRKKRLPSKPKKSDARIPGSFYIILFIINYFKKSSIKLILLLRSKSQ